jgi:steroid delta-isomerase-like uncharacterized protein
MDLAANLAANKALAARYYDEVLSGRDLGALDELLADDFTSWTMGGAQVDGAAYRQAVAASHRAFSDLRVTVLDQVAEGDKVVTRWRAEGVNDGDFAGLPATGRRVALAAIHVHRVDGGRLAEHWEALDQLDLLRQLGALPSGG